ncbi:DUF2079 domain-containing protein [Kitasatospora aureofaciens]|uniref:DUF2079 domain-containing protein n=1 Tax=Kitasatospora aureofaciens TaxID=1894 RepID=UPI0027E08959|nr:DUF2079 domain-containing protein [Kitasatospora aureofaciens]
MTTQTEATSAPLAEAAPGVRKPSSAVLHTPAGRTALLSVLCFAVMCAIGMQGWTSVSLGGFDLGIFDQGVRGYAHFGLPVSSLKSYHHEFPPGFSLLGDHFSPVLALLAPLYWIWDDPRSLIIGQALLFAAGVPLIRRITAHCFAATEPRTARRAADLAGLVYALGWPLLVASRVGFHEVAFAVPLTLLMLERGLARKYGTVVLAAVLLCCTKEDLGLMVGAYGLVLLLRTRGTEDRAGRFTGLGLLLGGPIAAVVAIKWLIPGMGGEPGYYWNYGSLGPDAGGALRNLLHDPLLLVQAAFDQPLKPLLLLWLFGTMFLLPLRSATVLCALPLLAERVLSSNPNHWSIARHYDSMLWPILLTATIEVLGRLTAGERTAQRARTLGLATAGCALLAAVPIGLMQLAVPSSWQPKASEAALVRAAALIPDGASVEADNQIAPRLTARTDVVLVDETPRGREYVLTRSNKRSFPFATDRQQADRIQLLLDHGYRQIWAEDGVALLHREGTDPIPGEHVPGPGSKPIQDVVPSDVGHNLFRG